MFPASSVKTFYPPNRAAKKTNMYKAVQALLKTKGIKVSVKQLRKIPKKRILRYIRRHFPPEIATNYLPAQLLYKRIRHVPAHTSPKKTWAEQAQTPLDTTETLEPVETDEIPVETNEIPEKIDGIPAETTDEHARNQAVVWDINQPLPPTREVVVNEESEQIQRVFNFQDDHPFDPGIWKAILQKLPDNYRIPDTSFITSLKMANQELFRINTEEKDHSI